MSARDPRTVVGEYTLLAPLGEGGMGVVHLASKANGPPVALKMLRPGMVGGEEGRRRLEREVRSLSRIRSHWIAEIVDADPWAEVPYIATRYVDGPSLHDLVKNQGPLAGADLVWLAYGLAEAIASVNAAGVLHRDVKPSNVLMQGRSPVLIDFGLARVADDQQLTQTGWLLGTPGYLAPEILQGADPSPAVDVHAWAATVAYAATGRAPFGKGPSTAVMDRTRRGEFDLAGVPPGLLEVLVACLDPDPARRPSLASVLIWLRPGVETGHPGPRPTVVEPVAATEVLGPRVPVGHGFEPVAELDWDSVVATDPRVGFIERGRRGLVWLGLGLVTAAGVSLAPWITLGLTAALLTLGRAGDYAASSRQVRHQLRGRRWYDAPQTLLTAPWELLRSLPTTVLLWLWSLGLGLSATLIAVAVGLEDRTSLAIGGGVYAASLVTGPESRHLRRPVGSGVALCGRTWLRTGVVCAVLLVTMAVFTLGLAEVNWWPDAGVPFNDR
ncbi:MAG: serine/threonine-protein kinase [Nocardioides sp.]